MIEVVSTPTDLGAWAPKKQPFYLEVYGEASPLVNEAYAEVVAAEGADAKDTADAPVYEYWWTLGHPGAVPLISTGGGRGRGTGRRGRSWPIRSPV